MDKLYFCNNCNSIICTNSGIQKLISSVEMTDKIKNSVKEKEILLFCFLEDELSSIKNDPKNFQFIITDNNYIKCKTCFENIGAVVFLKLSDEFRLSLGKLLQEKISSKNISNVEQKFNREIIGIQELKIINGLQEFDQLLDQMIEYTEKPFNNLLYITRINNAEDKLFLEKDDLLKDN